MVHYMNSQDHHVNGPPEDINVLKARIRELEQRVAEGEAIRESLAISEVKFKTIIDNLKDIIFTHDVNGTVIYVTSSVEQYGYSADDILGQNMLDFVHPDDWQMVSEIHNHFINFGGEMAFVVKLLTRSGQVRLIEDHAKAVLNREGKVTHVVGILRDITDKVATKEALENMNAQLEKRVSERTMELSKVYEDLKIEMKKRKRAEDAKGKSEHLLSAVIDFLPDPTFVIDANGMVIVWNHAMEELTGVETSSILEKGDYEYSLPFYGIKRPVLIDFALCPTKRQDDKYLGITKKGDTFIAEAFAPLLKSKPTYLWGIAKPYYGSKGKVDRD